MNKYSRWTPQEIQRMIELNKTHSRTEIAKITGRTYSAVKSKLRDLGVKNTREEISAKLAKPNSGHFSKGHVPHNTTDRKISIRYTKGLPIVYYRVKKGNWVPLKKLVWEKHHGPAPKGMVIRMIDKNQLNVEIGNMELVPMGLNMLYNSLHYNHPEVAETQYAISQLKKEINNGEPSRPQSNLV